MNSNNGHLVDWNKLSSEEKDQALRDGFKPIPQELQHAASRKLNGGKEANVSLTSGGKLSKYAAQQRRQFKKVKINNSVAQKTTPKKNKSKRKAAKQARKKNR